ncbi:MAG: lipocalin family protein [Bacteroidales bacterium]
MIRNIIILATVTLLVSCENNSNKERALLGNWIEEIPNSIDLVEGINLQEDGVAKSIGTPTLQYETWETIDNKLILSGKSLERRGTIEFIDTLDILSLTDDTLFVEKYGKYKFKYSRVSSLDDIKRFDVKDSLWKVDHTNEIQSREFQGVLPNQSCVELKHSITIYNYKDSGDGVYKLTTTFGSYNQDSSSSNSYGRLYTLRGSKGNNDAIIYELVPFAAGEKLYFHYQGDSLTVMTSSMEATTPISVFRLNN